MKSPGWEQYFEPEPIVEIVESDCPYKNECPLYNQDCADDFWNCKSCLERETEMLRLEVLG